MSGSSDRLPAPPGLVSYAMVMALVLIWGSTFLLVKFALRDAGPLLVAAARIGFAAAVLLPLALILRKPMPHGAGQWAGCCAVGLFSLALPFALLAWAQQVLPSGVAGVYMAVIPLLILPLAHVFSPGETMTRRRVVGFVIGFTGVMVLIGPETLGALGSADSLAQLACLGAAFSYAIGSILIRRTPQMDPISLSAAALAVASLLIAPFGAADWPQAALPASTWALLAGIGAISTALAMILRVAVITTAGSVFMSSAGYLVPITALLLGAMVGGERFAASDLAAVVLILGGLAIAQGLLRRPWRGAA